MASAAISGFKRLPGTAKRYVGPDGREYSYRQYRALKSALGLNEPRDYVSLSKQIRGTRRYRRFLKSYVEHERAAGRDVNQRRAAQDAKFKQAIKDLKTKGDTIADRTKRRDALELLGLRKNVPHWVPPGLSDKKKRMNLRPSRLPERLRMLDSAPVKQRGGE